MTVAYITELEQSVSDSLINTFKQLRQIQIQKEQSANDKTIPNIQSNELKFTHRAKLHNIAINHAQNILHHCVKTMHEGIKERAEQFKDYTEICFLSPPIPKENKTMYDRGKDLFNAIMEKSKPTFNDYLCSKVATPMISFAVVSFVGDVLLIIASCYCNCKEKVGNGLDEEEDRSDFG